MNIHPAINDGLQPDSKNFSDGVLSCLCSCNPVKVKFGAQTAQIKSNSHNNYKDIVTGRTVSDIFSGHYLC